MLECTSRQIVSSCERFTLPNGFFSSVQQSINRSKWSRQLRLPQIGLDSNTTCLLLLFSPRNASVFAREAKSMGGYSNSKGSHEIKEERNWQPSHLVFLLALGVELYLTDAAFASMQRVAPLSPGEGGSILFSQAFGGGLISRGGDLDKNSDSQTGRFSMI